MLLLLLLLTVAMTAIMIVGSFSTMCQSVPGGPLGVEETAGNPFSRI